MGIWDRRQAHDGDTSLAYWQTDDANTLLHYRFQQTTGVIGDSIYGNDMAVHADWSHVVTGPVLAAIPFALGMTSACTQTTFSTALPIGTADFSVVMVARANATFNIELESAFWMIHNGTNQYLRASVWTSGYANAWGYNFYSDVSGYKYAMYAKAELCDVFTDGNWHQVIYKFPRGQAKAIVSIDGNILSHSVDGGNISDLATMAMAPTYFNFYGGGGANLNATIAEICITKTLTVQSYGFPVSP